MDGRATPDAAVGSVAEPGAQWRIDGFVASLTGSAANTVEAYRRDLLDFAGWAVAQGVDTPQAVDRRLLRRHVAWLATAARPRTGAPMAKRSVARHVSSLRRYFRYLRREGVLEIDPSTALRAPAGDGKLPRVLDHDDVHALHDGATPEDEPHWRRLRDDAVLELLYGSGIRVGELCGLRADALESCERERAMIALTL